MIKTPTKLRVTSEPSLFHSPAEVAQNELFNFRQGHKKFDKDVQLKQAGSHNFESEWAMKLLVTFSNLQGYQLLSLYRGFNCCCHFQGGLGFMFCLKILGEGRVSWGFGH